MSDTTLAAWIDKALDAAEREGVSQFRDPDAQQAILDGVAELRAVRDPIARLGRPVFRGAFELVVTRGAGRAEVLAAFERLRHLSPAQVSAAKHAAAAESVAGREQWDADREAVAERIESIAKHTLMILGPILLAAL